MNPKNVRVAQNPNEEIPNEDVTVASLSKMIKLAKDRIWTSTELHSLYLDKGMKDLNQTRLLNKVTEYIGNKVVVLSSPGITSIIMLNEKASQIFRFERVNEDDIILRLIAKKINSLAKRLSLNDDVDKNLTRESLFGDTSSTILSHLDLISSKFQNSLSAAMIGSIIKSTVTPKPTLLQVYVGVLAHEKKTDKALT